MAVQALERAEEKGLVPSYRSAERRAVLGSGIGRLLGRHIENIARVHFSVSQKAKKIAVQVVASGLGNDVDTTAAGVADFRGEVATVDLELLHGLLADGRARAAGGAV